MDLSEYMDGLELTIEACDLTLENADKLPEELVCRAREVKADMESRLTETSIINDRRR